MNRVPQPHEAPSTFTIVVFSALLSSFAYIISNIIPLALHLPKRNDLFEIFVGLVSILFGIGFVTYVLRKIYKQVSFGKIFISGWMTVLIMSFMITIFYVIAFSKNWLPIPEGSRIIHIVPVVILKYNALGMMFSALIALIFKKQ